MADDNADLKERIARLETGTARLCDMSRIDAQLTAARDVIDKFIKLKDFGNGVLEERVRRVEETLATANVKLAGIDTLYALVAALEKRVRDTEVTNSGLNNSMATAKTVGGAALVGVVGIIVGLIVAFATGRFK